MSNAQTAVSVIPDAPELLDALGRAQAANGDLIAVKADPLTDIRVLERVDHVMKGGTIIR